MSRVITFSRLFPSYHPRKGESTNFVEQIWNGLNKLKLPVPKNTDVPSDFLWSILPLANYGFKYHTIRAGNRFKVGDKFSPRVWSGKPYRSKQIIIAPDIEIKKVWNFEVDVNGIYCINGLYIPEGTETEITKNDGLSNGDFFKWFMPNYMKPKAFKGQIICWNDKIEY